MELQNKVVIVTGGANGIGRALCRRFAAAGARGVVVADIDAVEAARVAAEIEGLAVPTDVSSEDDIKRLVARATKEYGPVDLFCSNAGIGMEGGFEVSDAAWQRIWQINFMAHVYAARAVVPQMLARGNGYLLQTSSAAGLLSQIGSAPYAVTKHAVVAFAEWLAITYGDRGLRVSCLCPQGVHTNLIDGDDKPLPVAFLRDGALQPEAVAEAVMAGLTEERFLILPHAEVAEYVRRKATDPDRWLRAMRRLQKEIYEGRGQGS